jgi:hypothetical protein
MLQCSIAGCKESLSEIFATRRQRAAWIVLNANDWPQMREGIDRTAFGEGFKTSVDKLTLCPAHRREVFLEVLEIKKLQTH